jgi:hypothetical protein
VALLLISSTDEHRGKVEPVTAELTPSFILIWRVVQMAAAKSTSAKASGAARRPPQNSGVF